MLVCGFAGLRVCRFAGFPSRETVSHSTKGKVKQALGDFFNMRRGGGAESNENGLQLPRRSEPRVFLQSRVLV